MPALLSSVGKRHGVSKPIRFDPTAVNHTPPNPKPWTFDPPKLARKMARLKRKAKFVDAIQQLRRRVGFNAWGQAHRALTSQLAASTSCPTEPHGPNDGCCSSLDCGFQIIDYGLQFKHRFGECIGAQLCLKFKCQTCAHETPFLPKEGAVSLMGAPKWEDAQKQLQGWQFLNSI